MKKIVLVLFYLVALVGCTNATDTTTADPTVSYYDPKVPFGQITYNSGLAGKLLNVTADTSQLNRIIFNWTLPPVYQTMNYEVKVYKKRGDDPNFVLPDPSDSASAAPLYLRTTVTAASTFTDQDYYDITNQLQTEVEQGGVYSYWFYIKVDTKWSPAVKLVVTARTATDTFIFPSAGQFWQYLRQGYGSPVAAPTPLVPDPVITYISMNYNPMTPTAIGAPVGGTAFAYAGNVMYYADTANNRVVIYTRGLAYSCDQYKVSNPDLYLACTYQYASAPLTAVNILGQDSHYSRKTCNNYESLCSAQTTEASCGSASSICSWTSIGINGTCSAQQKCLNKPSKVYVADGKLFISDSGNNRVVVYNSLPTKGCDKAIIPGNSQPIDCNPSFVVGKKSLADQTLSYPTSISSLDNPTGVTVDSGNLYIADTNNNRVVMIKSYADTTQFNCNDNDWENPPCAFTSVLGQKDFTSKWSFKDGSNDGSGLNREGTASIYDGITCSGGTCTSPYTTGTNGIAALNNEFTSLMMARYFRKPVDIRVSGNRLLVAANEEISLTSSLGTTQLRGRIMLWDNNPMIPGATQCNAALDLATFDSDNNCLVTRAIGQELPNKLIIVPSSGKYRDSSFGLDTVDAFDIKGNLLVAIDSLNNYVHQWIDFTVSTLAGSPYDARIVNPQGALDNSTGSPRYLPDLKGISDIKITPDNNLIFISDPVNSKVYEIRAFNYETPQ